ncbi:MAG: T9SS type A sorting domain-containing protein, partial [Bacteroidetes bacterium]|nr:T9SS type A sorting domain-containing protein [Bacteroidota bacterium]
DHGARDELRKELQVIYSTKPVVTPQPAQSIVNIGVPDAENAIISIYNSQGALMHEGQVTDPTTWYQVDVSNWINGIYIVRTNNSVKSSTKLLISK